MGRLPDLKRQVDCGIPQSRLCCTAHQFQSFRTPIQIHLCRHAHQIYYSENFRAALQLLHLLAICHSWNQETEAHKVGVERRCSANDITNDGEARRIQEGVNRTSLKHRSVFKVAPASMKRSADSWHTGGRISRIAAVHSQLFFSRIDAWCGQFKSTTHDLKLLPCAWRIPIGLCGLWSTRTPASTAKTQAQPPSTPSQPHYSPYAQAFEEH